MFPLRSRRGQEGPDKNLWSPAQHSDDRGFCTFLHLFRIFVFSYLASEL